MPEEIIYPLENIAEFMGVSRHCMYGHYANGEHYPGRLHELSRLGICFKSWVHSGGRSHKIWCAWKSRLQLWAELKAKKGEIIGSHKGHAG